MGKQLQLYLMPEDAREFERVLAPDHVLILNRYSSDGRPVISETATLPSPEMTAVDGYLVRSSDVGQVFYRNVPAQSRWIVDILRSPCIEFFGCHFDGTTLKRGRLFYDSGFYDDADNWVDKPADFQRWAKAVFRVARKCFKRELELGAYVGPRAKKWRDESHGTFLDFSPVLARIQ
ncbi:MAG TPA: hypothetical protein VNX18_11480 [Bryobacteraceae bacterium]|jgi:hypothetical protein|nr:hypothetical protein [Bryobacteraceae bacterium]